VNHYLRTELGYEDDTEYEILSGNVNRNWNWDLERSGGGFVNVAENMRQAMAADENLKVFVANGYYDLATPFFATEYTMNHLNLEPHLKSNIEMYYYEAGHMMYINQDSLVKLKQDLAGFIASLNQ